MIERATGEDRIEPHIFLSNKTMNPRNSAFS